MQQQPLTPQTPLVVVAQAWLAHFERRVAQRQRSSHTVDIYRRDLRLFGELASMEVGAISPPDIIRWHEWLCESQTSARAFAVYRALSAALGYARRHGCVSANAASRLDITHRAKPARPLTDEEVVQWRAGLDTLQAQRCAYAGQRNLEPRRMLGLLSSIQALRLLELTGRRLLEICSIPVSAVRLRSRCIFLEKTKTGPSAIALAPQAADLVAEQLAHLQGRSEWLFPTPSPTPADMHIGPNAVWESFHRACGIAGIRGANPHDLRHGWVFSALASGATLHDVSVAIGHKCEATTKKVYAAGMLVYPGMFAAAALVQAARDAAEQAVSQ